MPAHATGAKAADAPRTVVIFDCESDGKPRHQFGETGRGEQDFRWVQCTCACALVVPLDQLPSLDGAVGITCWRDVAETPGANPFEPLFEAFDAATLIVGFNTFEFDFPLLFKHYSKKTGGRRYIEHRIKSLDMFSRLRAVTNHWPKLDDLLRANGLPVKIANGREAVRMWQANEREELAEYCMEDVQCTARLALLPSLRFGQTDIPEHVYGLMPALAAVTVAEEEGEYVVV